MSLSMGNITSNNEIYGCAQPHDDHTFPREFEFHLHFLIEPPSSDVLPTSPIWLVKTNGERSFSQTGLTEVNEMN